MTQQALLEAMGRNYVAAIAIAKKKSNGYSRPDNAFLNFEQSAEFARTDVETGMKTRLGDKISRLGNLLDHTHVDMVDDETVRDTIVDFMNYLNLILCWREDVKQEDEMDAVIEQTLEQTRAYRTGDIINSYPTSTAAQKPIQPKMSWMDYLKDMTPIKLR